MCSNFDETEKFDSIGDKLPAILKKAFEKKLYADKRKQDIQ